MKVQTAPKQFLYVQKHILLTSIRPYDKCGLLYTGNIVAGVSM